MRIRSRAAGVLLLAAGIAGALTMTGTHLAASQGTTLVAMQTPDPVPVKDPWSSWWNRLPEVQVPLSAQRTAPPMGGRGYSMQARAVNDGENLYVLVQWPDTSPNRSVGRSQDFTDAVAVEFPASAGQTVPAFCMGDPNGTVNIWQWKAAWQEDVSGGFQGNVKDQYPNAESDGYPFHGDQVFYPGRYVNNPFSQTDRISAVDNLIAGGFGTLTADPTTEVTGWGAWRDGRWRVVLTRPLLVGREGNTDFGADDYTDVAFAVWDGAAGERDGLKSVANFSALHISSKSMGASPRFPYWPAPFFVVVGAWGLFVWMVAVRDRPRS